MFKSKILLFTFFVSCLHASAQDTIWSQLAFEELEEIVIAVEKNFQSTEGYYSYSISSYSGIEKNELLEKTDGFYFNNGKLKFTTMLDIEQLTNDSCSFVKLKNDQELFIQNANQATDQISSAGLSEKDFKLLKDKMSLKKGTIGKSYLIVVSYSDNIYNYEIRYHFGNDKSLEQIYWSKAQVKASSELEAAFVSSSIKKVTQGEIQAKLSSLGYSNLTTEEFLSGTNNFKVYDLRY